MKVIFLFIFIVFDLSATEVEKSFDYGKQVAESKKNDANGGINKEKDVPHYDGEFSIDKNELSKSAEILEDTGHARDLRDIHKTRKPFILEDKEAFIVRSENVHKHPEKEFDETETIEFGSDGNKTKYCEECTGEEYLVSARTIKKRYVYLDKEPYVKASKYCEKSEGEHGTLSIETRIVQEFDEMFREDGVLDIKPDPYRSRWTENNDSIIHEYYIVNGVPIELRKIVYQEGRPGIVSGCYLASDLRAYVVDNKDLIKDLLGSEHNKKIWWGQIGYANLHARVVNDTGEHYWIPEGADNHYEDLCDKGVCRYVNFTDDPLSNKFWKGKKVLGSWGRTVTYACQSNCKSTCAELEAKGCVRQPNPQCLEKKGGPGATLAKCLKWRWELKCKDRIGVAKHTFSKKNPFCLGGNCIDSSYDSDKDMVEALGYLAILEEARKDMDGTKNIQVFKGNERSCSKVKFVGLGIKDCCGNGRGLGVSLGLTECDESSRALSKLRAEGKCVYVGTHCAEMLRLVLLKTCIRRKSVFCCFGSKFAKLLQEQGRPQLGKSFGSSECPDCSGLTPEELSNIDFSKLDLSEIAKDVMDKFKPQNGDHFAKDKELERIQEQMKAKISDVPEIKKSVGVETRYLQENMKHLAESSKEGGRK